MGKRSTSRRVSMQALYQAECAGIDIKKSLENIFEQEEFIDETREFSSRLAQGAWKNLDKIDKIIEKYSREWKLERMGRVDRNILRLAIHELMEAEVPAQVVIDEAVEIAKKYSTTEASKFINGILGAFEKDIKKEK
ncbi:MAG TPA: transcription antitermination factor NusB, partial [Candidatus Omnitrophota bacterium]|nr:transcription antitermination factor NusB [Candidatus Omnitrophota bacterium]